MSFIAITHVQASTFGHPAGQLSLSEFVLGLLYCSESGELDLSPELARAMMRTSAAAFLRDKRERIDLCKVFVSDKEVQARRRAARAAASAPKGKVDAGVKADDSMPFTRNYIFSIIDSESVEYSKLHEDVGRLLVPFFLNVSLPNWDDALLDRATDSNRATDATHELDGPSPSPVVDGDSEGELDNQNDDDNGNGDDDDDDPLGLWDAHATVSTTASGWSPEYARSEPLISSHPGPPRTQFYIGGPGSGAPMHYHQDAVNTLIFGEKRWVRVRAMPFGRGLQSRSLICQCPKASQI